MKVIADTGGVIALLDSTDKHHQEVVSVVSRAELLIPATILAEVDYLATKYLREAVARAFVQDIIDGAFTYLPTTVDHLANALDIMSRYADIPIGLVDASVAVLADLNNIQHILTLDRRHFHLIRSEQFGHFHLLP